MLFKSIARIKRDINDLTVDFRKIRIPGNVQRVPCPSRDNRDKMPAWSHLID